MAENAAIEMNEELLDAIVIDSEDDSENALAELDAFIEEQENATVEVSEDELGDVEALIDLEEAKASSYEEQDTAEPEKIATVEPKVKTKAVRSTTGAPPSTAIRARLGANVYKTVLVSEDDVALDEEALKERVDGYLADFDGLAKKVGEKVVNFYAHLAGSAQLSNYSRIALDLLKEKGEITVADIRNQYLDYPYTHGTSSSQASQMHLMLPAVGIANKVGGKLVFNENCPVAELLF